MAAVLRNQDVVRWVKMAVAAGFLLLSMTPVHGQGTQTRHQVYRAAATVSVATLQVPEQAWKHLEKARTLALKHEAAEAERECEKALAIAPSFAAAHIMQASQQLIMRQYAAAILSVAEARKTDPDVQWAGVILASADNGLRRFEDALNELHALPSDEALSWQAIYEESRAAIGVGDKEAAMRLSAEALAAAPKKFTDAILLRTNALMLAQRWVEAKDCLTGYIATPGPQPHKEEVQKAMAMIVQHLKATESVNLASR